MPTVSRMMKYRDIGFVRNRVSRYVGRGMNRYASFVAEQRTAFPMVSKPTHEDLLRWWGEAMDYIDVEGPCVSCGTLDERLHIRIRPNYQMYQRGEKPDFARHCNPCFETVFGGYGSSPT